jgi:hypothetical protein
MGKAEIVSLDLFSMSLNELQLTLRFPKDLDTHLK